MFYGTGVLTSALPVVPPPLCLQEHIFKLMKSDSYARFLRSNIYQDLLLARKKVSCTPVSPLPHVLIFFFLNHFSFIFVTLIHFVAFIFDISMQLQRHLLLKDMFLSVCTSILISHFLYFRLSFLVTCLCVYVCHFMLETLVVVVVFISAKHLLSNVSK